jgi:hypothetical protein
LKRNDKIKEVENNLVRIINLLSGPQFNGRAHQIRTAANNAMSALNAETSRWRVLGWKIMRVFGL